jgi:hypothetical protein
MRMDKIWIVTDGDYSDYHIVGVFSTEERANEFVEVESGVVEEYMIDELCEAVYLKLNKNYSCYRVDMTLNEGDLLFTNIDPYSNVVGSDNDLTVFVFPPKHENKKFAGKKIFSIRVMAKDEKHAIKIANERRTEYIATGDLR